MDSALEQLQAATMRLAQAGSVKDRLEEAYTRHLCRVQLDHVPGEYRNQFAELCEAMSRERPLPRENPARASIRKMSCDEVIRHAMLIVNIFSAAARSAHAARQAEAARSADEDYRPVLQLVAAEG